MATLKKRKLEACDESGTGRIESLILENFKSYEGVNEIGPFEKFTSIIGPNGSGKSNVMDAVSFCLGINAKHLRGDRLRDLVHKKEDELPQWNRRKCSVTIVFRTGAGSVVHFARYIDPKGTSAYKYGPPDRLKVMNHDEFTAALASHRILVKARNFLVFQGDVMDLAKRQGTELAKILETISGSDKLKEEYVRLSKEVEVAQEKVRLHFQQRREIENAVAILEKQRKEVERYKELKAEREKVALEGALFRLCTAQNEETAIRQEVSTSRREVSVADTQLKAFKSQSEELESKRRTLEGELEKSTSSHDVLKSNLDQIRPEIATCKKQILHWQSRIEANQVSIDEERRRLIALHDQAAAARTRREEGEAELTALRNQSAEPVVRLTPAQLDEYNQAVAKSEAISGQARDRIVDLDEQIGRANRSLASHRLDLDELHERSVRMRARLETLNQEKKALREQGATASTALKEKQRAESAVAAELEKFKNFKDSLLDEQRTVRLKLDAAKGRRERLVVVEARQRIVDELRERFPAGVIGRVSELVLPAQKRFEIALQTAFGPTAEAFVVTTAAVARECIAYLKGKKISYETFIPLDRIFMPEAGQLQVLIRGNQSRRAAASCAKPNEKFFERHPRWSSTGMADVDKILASLLQSTIVTDDLAEAKRVVKKDAAHRLEPRVVTLQGEVITPSGDMCVEASQNITAKVAFGGADELREIQQQTARLESVEKDLATLSEQIEVKMRQQRELQEECRSLEDKVALSTSRLQNIDVMHSTEQALLSQTRGQADELQSKIRRSGSSVEEAERAKEFLETDLLKVGKRHFARLNQELGVPDIRSLMLQEQRQRKRWRDNVQQLEDKLRVLIAEERNVERAATGGGRLEALEKELKQHRTDIEENSKRQQRLEELEAERLAQVTASAAAVSELRLKKEAVDGQLKTNRAEAARLRHKHEELRKQLRTLEERLRLVLATKCLYYRDSLEKQVKVPLLAFNEDDRKRLEGLLYSDQNLDAWSLTALEDVSNRLSIDFAHLPDERRAAAAKTKVDDVRAMNLEYEARDAVLAKELQALSPNLKAVEELDLESAKLEELRKEGDEATAMSQKLARDFQAVKRERIARFSKCYRHVEAQVQPYYRMLTSYDGFEGGSAYLDLDDAEEPYNGGVTFTACPPGKRFFPMELLSGGEKSMASLSLLFAMHSYQPPPFMILDEVDAPFDRKNTNSLVRCLSGMNFQCLVISLKDTFFSHSDSIVGIFKDRDQQCSGSLSLPLRRFGQQSANLPTAAAALAASESEEQD